MAFIFYREDIALAYLPVHCTVAACLVHFFVLCLRAVPALWVGMGGGSGLERGGKGWKGGHEVNEGYIYLYIHILQSQVSGLMLGLDSRAGLYPTLFAP